ncbi:hypothetical protein ACP4OV_020780 [Aristida adscensionis]
MNRDAQLAATMVPGTKGPPITPLTRASPRGRHGGLPELSSLFCLSSPLSPPPTAPTPPLRSSPLPRASAPLQRPPPAAGAPPAASASYQGSMEETVAAMEGEAYPSQYRRPPQPRAGDEEEEQRILREVEHLMADGHSALDLSQHVEHMTKVLQVLGFHSMASAAQHWPTLPCLLRGRVPSLCSPCLTRCSKLPAPARSFSSSTWPWGRSPLRSVQAADRQNPSRHGWILLRGLRGRVHGCVHQRHGMSRPGL